MISVFELFKIGVGPSSSHTVGPMKAAAAFVRGLVETGAIDRVALVDVALLGSLAFTGKGHATDKAVILGLSGETPEHVDLDAAEALVVRGARDENAQPRRAARHCLRRRARNSLRHGDARAAPSQHDALRRARRGGQGARRRDLALGRRRVHHPRRRRRKTRPRPSLQLPYPFRSGAELLARGREAGLSIAELMRANEAALRSEARRRPTSSASSR